MGGHENLMDRQMDRRRARHNTTRLRRVYKKLEKGKKFQSTNLRTIFPWILFGLPFDFRSYNLTAGMFVVYFCKRMNFYYLQSGDSNSNNLYLEGSLESIKQKGAETIQVRVGRKTLRN